MTKMQALLFLSVAVFLQSAPAHAQNPAVGDAARFAPPDADDPAKRAASPPAMPQQGVDPSHAAGLAKGLAGFKKHVEPINESCCLRCHGGEKFGSELALNDRDGLLKGGLHGPARVPGKSKEGLLVRLVNHQKEPFMPK